MIKEIDVNHLAETLNDYIGCPNEVFESGEIEPICNCDEVCSIETPLSGEECWIKIFKAINFNEKKEN